MQIIFSNENLSEPVEMLLRRAGYSYLPNRRGGDDSFVRRLGYGEYPRFHVYYKLEVQNSVINLHLDQKKPSYNGFHAHNAEYSGDLVAEEARRIKSFG